MPPFFQQVVGGLVATLAATLITAADLVPIDRPTLVSAAAITVMLSGMSSVAAMQDAITGYSITAAGRAVEIAQLSAGLIAGVVLALQAAPLLGLPPNPPELPTAGPALLPVMALAGAGAAAFFALAGYARLRALPVAAVAGAIGVTVNTLLISAGIHPIRRPPSRRRWPVSVEVCSPAGSGSHRWSSRCPGSPRCCPGSPPTAGSTSWWRAAAWSG